MFTRSLDEIIRATNVLPDHLLTARRYYGHDPEAVRAFRRLQDALMEVDAALVRAGTKPLSLGVPVAAEP